LLDDAREVMFHVDKYETLFVKDLMSIPPELIYANDPMNLVMDKFEDTGAWNLPVVDSNGKYMGFVSKSKIFSAYRQMLVQFSDE